MVAANHARITDADLDRLNIADARRWSRHAARGDFAAAWVVGDRILARTRRFQDPRTRRHVRLLWDGTPLANRRVLIRCDCGLGDTVQFIRYAPLVAERARSIAISAPPALLDVLRRSRSRLGVLPIHESVPQEEYDVAIEVVELPFAFRSTLDDLPARVPYLEAERAVLPAASPRIGIVWRASGGDGQRSIPFADLAPLFAITNVSWFSLQYEQHAAESHGSLRRTDTADLARTAALMRGVDLVVTIDSLPAHLAGALAVPVWTLLPQRACARWLTVRTDSPWYPTMRLFRQRRAGEWASVLRAVGRAIEHGEWNLPATSRFAN